MSNPTGVNCQLIALGSARGPVVPTIQDIDGETF
jgi:hypothetical protein